MKILITGGAGFIGSHTADALLGLGHEIRILDTLNPPVHADRRFPEHLQDRGIELVDGDVRDREAWEKTLTGVDAVYHLGAYQDYLTDFSTFFTTNTASTALMYEVLMARGQKLSRVVVASSQAVYGEGAYRRPACPDSGELRPGPRSPERLDRGLWELSCPSCGTDLEPLWTTEDTVRPHNSYALSKYGEESVALMLGERYGIPTVALRYSIVQGARQSFRNAYSDILRIFSQRVLNHRPPLCYEDGRQLRDYVSVHDVIRANVLVLDDDRAVGRAFNVGGARRLTTCEYADLVTRAAGADLEPRIAGSYRVGDTRHVLSGTEALGALGWRPVVDMSSVIAEYLTWATAQPGFADFSAEADSRMYALGTLRRVG
ncbi:MAG TPA: NAD-dependent epimerase/dehydratase family protein [Actinocrinis sp.]|jgi:dTDP-L-rhamnose 4-epimerase|uniref:NAD-dependent epimerase/dehydratase family protein n=1 Tax=Actinocrinis sp. TaxID=1920516 RepID=UPI002DDD6F92|nr:NAD-dependent epimerase/dehydratase family protein [Actinocrinis sp.]HEV3171106.1 NAD-dependent epimerase/dehydratase family protein [Actinocrinis sp.]